MWCRSSAFMMSLRKLKITRLKTMCMSLSSENGLPIKCLSSRDILGSRQHSCSCLALTSSHAMSNSLLVNNSNNYCTASESILNKDILGDINSFMTTSDSQTANELGPVMLVYQNFISPEEEEQLFNEIEPYMKRLRYEYDHWDGAIHGYRETERRKWTKSNDAVLKRVGDLAFPSGVQPLAHVHILDLNKDGHIKPHIDAVRFCGSTIAGLCLLSPCVMRLVHDKDKQRWADVLLERRSLYIMKDTARYNYTHEVLSNEKSVFNGRPVPKERRISVIMRNEAS
ncbi:alpha-ketoglutarate-dependent dioxygenase alkB homolog 7, mitochondrial-like [Mizuhopecten yessoensis]|uniref:Alpha-ketoglutarate-dependent dioxygenase alkB-like 7 n=1 Tax=Mizuhopecten yessoensis TaxID=6573 RepID=A0A210Q0D4_MIZYE|nr:alpha-ketoglutarate-dependent dioxygenase alkB homolog 7, mitochondrial-like [Mizuhopecten yessoensis]OWF42119.1 Alpha-ketoglutarate-dependent dioxygenase alkB-like 7 [Mizuhopecten yessoensis]